MVRSLESVPGPRLLRPRPGTCPEIQGGELEHHSFPYQSREGSPAPGGTWMLEVTGGGNRDEVGDTQRWHISAGTVDASTRKIEVPGDTWRREELGSVGP